MKITYLLACTVFVLAGIKTYGQESPGLSLPDLWEEAFSNYPSLEAYRSQQRQADFNQRLTRNQYLPEVYLQAQTSLGTQNAISGSFFPLAGLYNVSGSELNGTSNHGTNTFGSVIMDWKFLQFGKQKKSQEAAKIISSQAMHRLNVEQLRMQAEISRTYFQFFYYQGMEHWAQNNTERVRAILRASASRARSGLSPGADSLLVNATLNQTSAELSLWQGRREETKIALARWLNLSANELSLNESSILRSGIRQGLSVPEENQGLHPVLAFKGEQIAYAEKQKELASVTALPSLSLLAGAQIRGNSLNNEASFYENWEHSYNNPVHNYAVGLGLTWNLGDAFDSKLQKRRYQERVRETQAETEEVALGLRSQEEISRRQIRQSEDQIADAEQAYESAEEAYRLFEARYMSGLISITELLQIQDVLQRTEKIRIEAYYQYWIHQVNLAESTADFFHLQSQFK